MAGSRSGNGAFGWLRGGGAFVVAAAGACCPPGVVAGRPVRGGAGAVLEGRAAAVPRGGAMVDGLRHCGRCGLRGVAGRRCAPRGSAAAGRGGSRARAPAPAQRGCRVAGRGRPGADGGGEPAAGPAAWPGLHGPVSAADPGVPLGRRGAPVQPHRVAVLWAACEEATDLGDAFPRLERRHGAGRAAALVSLAWAAQHAVMPALPGCRYATSRVVGPGRSRQTKVPGRSIPGRARLAEGYPASGRG